MLTIEPRAIPPSRKRQRQGDLLGQALINIERDKLKLLQDNKRKIENNHLDADRHFFESLIPHVQKMDPLTKLQFRSRVQELGIHYSYGSPPASSTSSSTYASYQNPQQMETSILARHKTVPRRR
ncbi:BESS motif [Popillia japonica]|uniref:BESS motif n=1 Tax=Popillia japonica TaxID=7064 RepID=A0AAW1JL68_POPJA